MIPLQSASLIPTSMGYMSSGLPNWHKIRDSTTFRYPRPSLRNMIKMVPRGSSASADPYLTPEIKDYLRGFVKGFEDGHLDNIRCDFMQSDGGLVSHKGFSGLKGILSGPAG